jgi:hypothetical protein
VSSRSAIPDDAKNIIAFKAGAIDSAPTSERRRGRIEVIDALRGQLAEQTYDASYSPTAAAMVDKYRYRYMFLGVAEPQADGRLEIDQCWLDNDLRRARVVWGTTACITIISCDGDDPDAFEEMSRPERRERSGGWKRFPLRSGKRLDTFLMKATHVDLWVFECATDEDPDGEEFATDFMPTSAVVEKLPTLARLVEAEPDDTARLLHVHGGGTGDLARITHALRTGEWPTTTDPAEEAAAFAFNLLTYARYAEQSLMGVAWEVRGEVRAFLPPPPTAVTRELERLYGKIRIASSGLGYYDFWQHGGAASATAEETAKMEAEFNENVKTRDSTKAALEARIATLRAEAPAELDAWAFAHYCYVSQFIHECAEKGEADSTAAEAATRERAKWAELRAGTRSYVDECGFVRLDELFYHQYFGIDMATLENVEPPR